MNLCVLQKNVGVLGNSKIGIFLITAMFCIYGSWHATKSHKNFLKTWCDLCEWIIIRYFYYFLKNHCNIRCKTEENCSSIPRPPGRNEGEMLPEAMAIITIEMGSCQTFAAIGLNLLKFRTHPHAAWNDFNTRGENSTHWKHSHFAIVLCQHFENTAWICLKCQKYQLVMEGVRW